MRLKYEIRLKSQMRNLRNTIKITCEKYEIGFKSHMKNMKYD